MLTIIDFKYGMTSVEVVTGNQTGSFELGQDPVDRSQCNFFARIKQHLINVFRLQMTIRGIFQQFQNFHTRQGYLQPRVFYVGCFHLIYSQCLQQTGPVSIIAPSISIVGIMILRLLQTALISGLAIVTLSGCVYRMDIPQGNRIDPALVEQLEIGMSRNQVEFLLGTPSIVDLHHPDQWYYVFYLKTGDDGEIQKSVMTLTFTGDLLSMIDGNLNPG